MKKEDAWKIIEETTTPIIEEVVRLLSSVSILRLHIRSVLEIVTEDNYYELGYQKKLTKRIKEAVKELQKQQEQFNNDKSFQAEIGAKIEQLKSVQSTLDNQYDQIRLIIPELMAASSLLENSGILKKGKQEMLKTGDIIEREEDGSLIIDVGDSGCSTYTVTEFVDGTIMIKPKERGNNEKFTGKHQGR